jgi:hypothetical protein
MFSLGSPVGVRAAIVEGSTWTRARDASSGLGLQILLLLPGIATVYFSFNSGGFFPGTQAFGATCIALVLIIRTLLAERPFEGFGPRLRIATAGLGLYAIWILASQHWSHAPGRALLAFDRALLYLLILLLFGTVAHNRAHLQRMVEGLAAAIVLVCLAALITRVLPDVWPVELGVAPNRLSYPLSYWNALGILSALGGVLLLYLTTSLQVPAAERVAAAAFLPLVVTTLLFTYSRGGAAAFVLGMLLYLIAGRPRGALTGLIAVVPAAALAVVTSYHAELLAGPQPTSVAATAQGHHTALILALCATGAGVARAMLLAADRRGTALRLDARVPRPVVSTVRALTVGVPVALFFALHGPDALSRQYDRFVTKEPTASGDIRGRLVDPANLGRVEQWQVALRGFREAKLDGLGADTYAVLWTKRRPRAYAVTDAHSLYLETLAELGLVGLAALALALIAIALGVATKIRSAERSLYAALAACVLIWALHAGVDWDWEMPAVTAWLFAVGAVVLVRRGGPDRTGAALLGDRARFLLAPVWLALAIVPTVVAISQAHLTRSITAFQAGDCDRAIREARSSSSVLSARPDPYALIGYCELRRRQPKLAVTAMESAVERDPQFFLWRYGLALSRAAAGLDPRPAAREALRLSPLDPLSRDVVKRFATGDRRLWARRARSAAIPERFLR